MALVRWATGPATSHAGSVMTGASDAIGGTNTYVRTVDVCILAMYIAK